MLEVLPVCGGREVTNAGTVIQQFIGACQLVLQLDVSGIPCCYPNWMDLERLVDHTVGLLEREEALFFLGAGASLGNGTEKGAPSSHGLRQAIVDEYGLTLEDESGLETAATVAVDDYGEPEVRKFVANTIMQRCPSPLRAHKALARIAPPVVMTTNFDDLYEQALEQAHYREGIDFAKVVRKENMPHLGRMKTSVFKLHGDVHAIDEMVLTTPDYRRWPSREEHFLNLLRAELQRYVCVFVGYSLRDPNMRLVLGMVENSQAKFAPRHFALDRSITKEKAIGWKDLVTFVEGDATEFFERVAERWEVARPRRVDLGAERQKFTRALQDGRLETAVESCRVIEEECRKQQTLETPAYLWQRLGELADGLNQEVAKLAHNRAAELWVEVSTLTRYRADGGAT